MNPAATTTTDAYLRTLSRGENGFGNSGISEARRGRGPGGMRPQAVKDWRSTG